MKCKCINLFIALLFLFFIAGCGSRTLPEEFEKAYSAFQRIEAAHYTTINSLAGEESAHAEYYWDGENSIYTSWNEESTVHTHVYTTPNGQYTSQMIPENTDGPYLLYPASDPHDYHRIYNIDIDQLSRSFQSVTTENNITKVTFSFEPEKNETLVYHIKDGKIVCVEILYSPAITNADGTSVNIEMTSTYNILDIAKHEAEEIIASTAADFDLQDIAPTMPTPPQ